MIKAQKKKKNFLYVVLYLCLSVAVRKWRKIRRDTVSSSSSWPPNNEPGQLRVALRIEIAYLSAAYVIVDWRQLLARHLVQTRAGTFGMFRLA